MSPPGSTAIASTATAGSTIWNGLGSNSSTTSSTVTITRSGRERRLLLDAAYAPDRHVAPSVGLLGVDHRHVGVQRRNRHKLLARERARDGGDGGRHFRQVGADVAPQDGEGKVRSPGDVAVGHAGVGVLLYLQRTRPAVLHGVAEAVEGAHAGVATPGEDQLARRSPSRSSGRR